MEQLRAVVDGVVESHDRRVDPHALEEPIHRHSELLLVHRDFACVYFPETMANSFLDFPAC